MLIRSFENCESGLSQELSLNKRNWQRTFSLKSGCGVGCASDNDSIMLQLLMLSATHVNVLVVCKYGSEPVMLSLQTTLSRALVKQIW